MDSLTLPGVSMPISSLVLGTMTFGDTADREGAQKLFEAALSAGITAVDTANGYAGGEAERILSRLIAGRRERIVLATKAGIPHPDADGHAPLSARGLRLAVEGSLRRLDTDYIDIFYLHQPDRATPIEETLETVAALVDDGTIKALGVSNYSAWQIAEMNHAAAHVGRTRPVVAQQVYSLVARRLDDEYMEFARSVDLATMAYNPLAGGLLSGRHSFTDRPAEGRFGSSRLAQMYSDRYWNETMFAAIEELRRIADNAAITLPELALRWTVTAPGIGAVLLGGSKIEHLESNIVAASKGQLPADVLAACDAVRDELSGPMPAYNR